MDLFSQKILGKQFEMVKTFYRIMLDPFHTYIKKGKEKEEGL